MSTLGVGLIGAGDVSTLHARGVAESPDARLVALWNRTPEKATQRAAEFGCRTEPSPEALAGASDVDVVLVLTNHETHLQYAKLALEAGKHVLVEKPAGRNVEEIAEMRDLAARQGRCIAPVHNYIYEPGLERTRDMIDSGRLGDLVSTTITYNIHHPEVVAARYPGVIRQIMTHHSYVLLYLAGAPQSVSCERATINDGSVTQENLAMAQLKMRNGSLAHLCASFAADDHSGDPWTFLVKVIGTKGATRYSYRDWVENQKAVVHSHTFSAYPYTIVSTVRHFLERVVQRGEAPLSSLDDAITCQRLIEACELSADEGRRIDLPE